jgi:hypothetical protein
MDSEILNWIVEALSKFKIHAKAVELHNARAIIRQTTRTFVDGHPRAWWMALKGKPKVYDSKSHKLSEVVPSLHETVWFIPETEMEDLPVIELSVSQIERVVNDCPFFEYYVVDKQNRWLVTESDHNEFYVVSSEQ